MNAMDCIRDYMRTAEAIKRLHAQKAHLQTVCASMYQLAGLVGAPVRFLDALSRPCEATQQEIYALLPVRADEIAILEENLALRSLLKDARDALQFFKTWGESLNSVVGYNATVESWGPTLVMIARIDAALKGNSGSCSAARPIDRAKARPDGNLMTPKFFAFVLTVWYPACCLGFWMARDLLSLDNFVLGFIAFVYALFAPLIYKVLKS